MPTTLVSSSQHPLKSIVETSSSQSKEPTKLITSSNTKTAYIDPLSEATIDPLSKMVADVSFKEKVSSLHVIVAQVINNYI
jgi:hypothetical protein